jgi:hypothetical protein
VGSEGDKQMRNAGTLRDGGKYSAQFSAIVRPEGGTATYGLAAECKLWYFGNSVFKELRRYLYTGETVVLKVSALIQRKEIIFLGL